MITELFAVPIFSDNLKLDLDNLTDSSKISTYDHILEGNYFISSNTKILDLDKLKNEKEVILNKINCFLHDLFGISKKNEFYITSSWFVKFSKNSWAQKHIHSNSIFSGVIYLNNDLGGEICFHKDNRYHNISYPTIELEYDSWNAINSDFWKFKPKKGDIFLFPSNVTHSVEKNLSDNERISLAFNVFARGKFGIHESTIQI
jgi:uncharacterized protein (TIGR02466 family)